jgi:hypothetical protein
MVIAAKATSSASTNAAPMALCLTCVNKRCKLIVKFACAECKEETNERQKSNRITNLSYMATSRNRLMSVTVTTQKRTQFIITKGTAILPSISGNESESIWCL